MRLPGLPQARQGREAAPQWAWTEAEVWTERMLATLERGITGGNQCLLRRTRINLHGLSPSQSGRPSTTKPLTGEPYARKSPVRFGGRGGVQLLAPTPILARNERGERERIWIGV